MSRVELHCLDCGGRLSTIIPNENIVKCEHCGLIYTIVGSELRPGGQAKIYDRAMRYLNIENKDDYEALRLFESLGTYGNSIEMAEKIRAKIENDKREKEIQKNEKVVKKQKREMLALFLIFIVGNALIINKIRTGIYEKKLEKYNEAVALYESGDYENAILKFSKIRHFSNSEEYIDNAQAGIVEREKIYNNGVQYFEAGLYTKALSEFERIAIPYEEKDVYIEKCAANLYTQAESLYYEDNLDKARVILTDIPSNTETSVKAEGLLISIDDELEARRNKSTFESAVRLYEEGCLVESQRSFLTLTGYKSAETYMYLSEIGNSIYMDAMEAFNAGDYVKCNDYIDYIDEENEWVSYELSKELLENAKSAYSDSLKDEARNICRSDGYGSMCVFLDGKVCDLLTTTEADQLKMQCEVKSLEMRSLDVYQSAKYSLGHVESVDDNVGNHYLFAYEGYLDIEDGDCYETFYIPSGDYNFRTLTATVAVQKPRTSIDTRRVGVIRIYGDGRLLWSDTHIASTTKPYQIEVPVGGIEEVKIEMYGDGNLSSTGIHVLLCDPVLME